MDGGSSLGRFKSEESRQRLFDVLRQNRQVRWSGRVAIPASGCHPLVRRLYEVLNQQQAQVTEVAAEAGVTKGTMWSWKRRTMPRVDDLDAAFNVLGYRLAAVPIANDIEPEWVLKFGLSPAERAIVTVMTEAFPKFMTYEEVTTLACIAANAGKVYFSRLRAKGVNIETDRPGYNGRYGGRKYRIDPEQFK